MARKLRLGRLLSHAGAAAAEAAVTRYGKARERLTRPYTCNCGWHGRTYKAMNAHHLARHGNYWGGKAGKAMGRKVGKVQDAARRHARGWREAHGHIDRLGRPTLKGRTHPGLPARPTLRDLAKGDRHDRHYDLAEARERRAEAATARGRHSKAERLRNKAARGRETAGKTWRERRAHRRQPETERGGGYNMIPRNHPAHPSRAPARPPRTRTDRASGNGSRPPRTGTTPERAVSTSRPEPARGGGRLAPAPNGTRTAPARTTRTR